MSTTKPPHRHHAGVVRRDVVIHSAGQCCEGWLYLPPGSAPHPCVVLAHGIGGIRSAALPDFASRFAAAGISALTFDYRHLGTSEGQPRGLIDIKRQRADYRAAIEFARHVDEIDSRRIALWGTSFGGGHVLATAARDHKIAAAIIQNPFVDGSAAAAAVIRSGGRRHAYRLAWRAARDTLAARRGSRPVWVDLAGPPGSAAMMTTPDAVAGFESILPHEPHGFEWAVPARIVLQMRADRPAARSHLVKCPMLVCVCERDLIAPPQPAITVSRHAPRGELRCYPIGHFDLFHAPWFDRIIDDQLAFLRRTLLESVPQDDAGSGR